MSAVVTKALSPHRKYSISLSDDPANSVGLSIYLTKDWTNNGVLSCRRLDLAEPVVRATCQKAKELQLEFCADGHLYFNYELYNFMETTKANHEEVEAQEQVQIARTYLERA